MKATVCEHVKACIVCDDKLAKYLTKIHEKVVQSVPYMRSYTRALFEFEIMVQGTSLPPPKEIKWLFFKCSMMFKNTNIPEKF